MTMYPYGPPDQNNPNPFQNYYDQQRPSTSGVPFQPMQPNSFNPAFHHPPPPQHPQVQKLQTAQAKQRHMNNWMNDHCHAPAYNPSPAHSVQSHGSLGSLNSNFSRFSINTQLTINTQFTYDPFAYQYQQQGTENIMPRQQKSVPWTQQMANENVLHVIDALWKTPLHKIKNDVIRCLQFIVSGKEDPRQTVNPSQMIPLDCIDDKQVEELLRAMFSAVKFCEDTLNTVEAKDIPVWDKQVNKVIKCVTLIYNRFFKKNQLDKFDTMIDSVLGKNLGLLVELLIPNKEFTHNVITLFYTIVAVRNLQNPKRRRERLSKIAKEFTAISRLISIITPDIEYMSHLDRQLALDSLKCFLVYADVRRQVLRTNFIPEILRRYFKPTGDEAVLYKIPSVLLKFSNVKITDSSNIIDPHKKEIQDDFFKIFERVNGYQYLSDVLTHGSPRVLVSCLDFIVFLDPSRLPNINCLDALAVAAMRLVGSSEAKITDGALKFLVNATANNGEIKRILTENKGVASLFQAVRQQYHSSSDGTVRLEAVQLMEQDIRRHCLRVLHNLLFNRKDQSATNPLIKQAIEDAIAFHDLPSLVCNWLNQKLDDDRIEMIKIVLELTIQAPDQQLFEAVSQPVQLQGGPKHTSIVQAIVEVLFTIFMYHDNTIQNNQNMKNLHWSLVYHASYIIFLFAKKEKIRPSIMGFLGRTSQAESLINLFCVTSSCEMHQFLFDLMRSLISENDYVLMKLPQAWAHHPQFFPVIEFFKKSQNEDTARAAHFMEELARRQQ